MKFMVHWSIDQAQWLDVLKVFSSMTPAQRADAGPGVKMIGRWHDTAARTGVAIMEATDLAALHRYLNRWNPSMDIEVSPVLDDEEAASLGRAVLSDHGA
jgi:hypothetical protein